MQYKTLRHLVQKSTGNGVARVTIPEELFQALLISALRSKNEFDEDFYVASNPDIRQAIKRGTLQNGAEHYFNSGYFEGRMPKKFVVDEKFYAAKNADVAKGIAQKKVKSCQEHFDFNGFAEGRFPYEDFSLF